MDIAECMEGDKEKEGTGEMRKGMKIMETKLAHGLKRPNN
jgi:hypothetical protein